MGWGYSLKISSNLIFWKKVLSMKFSKLCFWRGVFLVAVSLANTPDNTTKIPLEIVKNPARIICSVILWCWNYGNGISLYSTFDLRYLLFSFIFRLKKYFLKKIVCLDWYMYFCVGPQKPANEIFLEVSHKYPKASLCFCSRLYSREYLPLEHNNIPQSKTYEETLDLVRSMNGT